jgi:porin
MSPRETNVFAGDETEQFLNTAFNVNPAYLTTVPQSFLGAGLILIPHEDIMLTTLVLDADGVADECGLDTVLDRGTSIFQQIEVKVRPCGLPGHQRFGWTWSDKVKTRLGQNSRLLIEELIRYQLGLGPAPQLDEAGSDWAFFYDFDQYLYVVPGTKDQGIGLFGRFGVTDGRANPVGAFYSLGVGGKGLIPTRENDSFGVGYYYLRTSDKLGPIGRRLLDGCEQGVEVYYNIAVTPWLKITPSVQVIDPMRKGVDTTVVAGVRAKIDF